MKDKDYIIKNSVPRKKHISCIYFLINRYDDIIYIGETDSFYERIKVHNKNKKLIYSRYFLLKTDCSKHERRIIETKYIKKYKPLYNFKDNPIYENNRNYHFRMFFKHCKGFKQISDITNLSETTVKSILLDESGHKTKNIQLVYDAVIKVKTRDI